MKFTYKGQRITLTGVMDDIAQCSQVSYRKLEGLLRHGAITHCIQLNSVQDSVNHSAVPEESMICSIQHEPQIPVLQKCSK